MGLYGQTLITSLSAKEFFQLSLISIFLNEKNVEKERAYSRMMISNEQICFSPKSVLN
jgi:hypothetical protein